MSLNCQQLTAKLSTKSIDSPNSIEKVAVELTSNEISNSLKKKADYK